MRSVGHEFVRQSRGRGDQQRDAILAHGMRIAADEQLPNLLRFQEGARTVLEVVSERTRERFARRVVAAAREVSETLIRVERVRFVVLGFPCDQFGHQEPGTEAEIQQFCADRYALTFPLFSKVEVNGSNTHPLFEILKQARPGLLGTRAIKWNFTKFLVSATGEVLQRFGPRDTPMVIEPILRDLLP